MQICGLAICCNCRTDHFYLLHIMKLFFLGRRSFFKTFMPTLKSLTIHFIEIANVFAKMLHLCCFSWHCTFVEQIIFICYANIQITIRLTEIASVFFLLICANLWPSDLLHWHCTIVEQTIFICANLHNFLVFFMLTFQTHLCWFCIWLAKSVSILQAKSVLHASLKLKVFFLLLCGLAKNCLYAAVKSLHIRWTNYFYSLCKHSNHCTLHWNCKCFFC